MLMIVVFAKEPEPGRVKTRFCPPCTPDQAAELYRAFVRDTLALVDAWAESRGDPVRRVLAYASRGEPAWLRSAAGAAWELIDQGRGDLGDRLVRITGKITPAGPTLVIGSDSPTLPPAYLEQAARALDRHDAALGPSADGGYWIIGLRRAMPRLFWRIPWSTPDVWARTVERVERLGVRWTRLPEWYDLDSMNALRDWLARDPAGSDALFTRAAVRDLRI